MSQRGYMKWQCRISLEWHAWEKRNSSTYSFFQNEVWKICHSWMDHRASPSKVTLTSATWRSRINKTFLCWHTPNRDDCICIFIWFLLTTSMHLAKKGPAVPLFLWKVCFIDLADTHFPFFAPNYDGIEAFDNEENIFSCIFFLSTSSFKCKD